MVISYTFYLVCQKTIFTTIMISWIQKKKKIPTDLNSPFRNSNEIFAKIVSSSAWWNAIKYKRSTPPKQSEHGTSSASENRTRHLKPVSAQLLNSEQQIVRLLIKWQPDSCAVKTQRAAGNTSDRSDGPLLDEFHFMPNILWEGPCWPVCAPWQMFVHGLLTCTHSFCSPSVNSVREELETIDQKWRVCHWFPWFRGGGD